MDDQYPRGGEGSRAGEERAAPSANDVQTNSSQELPPFDDVPASTATRATSATATSTTVTSKCPATAVRRGGLGGVLFVNPDAAQARAHRRDKLDASRSRAAYSVPRSCDPNTAQRDHRLKEIRRGERALRNRESAALSRKRKTNRVGELEIQVEILEEENRRLRLHAAHLERSGIDDNNGINPPPMPAIFPSTSSVVDEEARGRQAPAKNILLTPPSPPAAAAVEQALIEEGTGTRSAVTVACGAQQQQQQEEGLPAGVWTHNGASTRPFYSDSSEFCSDSSDAEDTIDRLFVALMAQEAAAREGGGGGGREEERGAASSTVVGAGLAVLQGGKGGKYARFDQNGARRGMLAHVNSVFGYEAAGRG